MDKKDYYKVLGVERKASKDQIKKSYKDLAKKYHPDIASPSNKQTYEKKFKEISEAYAVLSDDKKRKQYDMFGTDGFHSRYSQEDIFQGADFSQVLKDIDLNDIFDMFGGGAKRSRAKNSYGSNFEGGFGFSHSQANANIKGSDVEYPLTIGFFDAYHGCKKNIEYRLSVGSNPVKLAVTIPKGIKNGTKLKLAKKGSSSPHPAGTSGDLYIKISITDHPKYARDENDNIIIDKKITLSQALAGAKLEIDTLVGKKIVTIPACTNQGTKLRLRNLGFAKLNSKNKDSDSFGDLYIQILVSLPDKLTEPLEKIASELKSLGY